MGPPFPHLQTEIKKPCFPGFVSVGPGPPASDSLVERVKRKILVPPDPESESPKLGPGDAAGSRRFAGDALLTSLELLVHCLVIPLSRWQMGLSSLNQSSTLYSPEAEKQGREREEGGTILKHLSTGRSKEHLAWGFPETELNLVR